MKKIISATHINKSFGYNDEKRLVLNDISLDINEGEFISVMGPSGSGKSTLMYALSGLDKIDSGQVLFNEKEISSLNEKHLSELRRNQMGFVFQQPTLLNNLNIIDNIILPSIRNNKKNKKKIIENASILMEKIGLKDLDKRDITQVSGGQLQRAGICRVLMNNPKIIFGDEPTGALNSKSAGDVMEILQSINQEGTTIMLVTHDVNVASRSDRILFLVDGRIIDEMTLSKYNQNDAESRVKKVMNKMIALGI